MVVGRLLVGADFLCTLLLAYRIRSGGVRRGVVAESLGGAWDPSGCGTALGAVPGVSWAYKTRCVRCPVALGWPLGAPDLLCTLLLASSIKPGAFSCTMALLVLGFQTCFRHI